MEDFSFGGQYLEFVQYRVVWINGFRQVLRRRTKREGGEEEVEEEEKEEKADEEEKRRKGRRGKGRE